MSAPSIDMPQIRQLFTVASESEDSCKELLTLTDGYTMDYRPVVYAYHAAAEMTLANHVTWPGTKLKYFNRGKYKLEEVVNKYNSLVEIRYIRFAVQYGSPSFLGYRDDIEKDRKFIKENMENSTIPDKMKRIINATIQQK
jgi:hypothetical protein